MEVSSVERTLLSLAKTLDKASLTLSGLETGFRTEIQISVTKQVAEILALDPAVGSLATAQKLITSFQREASRIAHVCMIARADLPKQPSKRGRPSLDWYDDFTALLLAVAEKAGINPTARDRPHLRGSKWLAACRRAGTRVIFLPAKMRTRKLEARFKRLERSRERLKTETTKSPRALSISVM